MHQKLVGELPPIHSSMGLPTANECLIHRNDGHDPFDSENTSAECDFMRYLCLISNSSLNHRVQRS